jgi:hypothetical protein
MAGNCRFVQRIFTFLSYRFSRLVVALRSEAHGVAGRTDDV